MLLISNSPDGLITVDKASEGRSASLVFNAILSLLTFTMSTILPLSVLKTRSLVIPELFSESTCFDCKAWLYRNRTIPNKRQLPKAKPNDQRIHLVVTNRLVFDGLAKRLSEIDFILVLVFSLFISFSLFILLRVS